MGSFNTFGKTSKSYGSGKNIWHEIKGAYPVGGTIANLSAYKEGDVIPAGSMCALDQVAHTITIVKAGDAENLANVNGLLQNDIYVDAAVKGEYGNATGNVVFAGEIYIDRLAEAVPTEVLAKLPMIVAIKEA
jgi:hypothetical protein